MTSRRPIRALLWCSVVLSALGVLLFGGFAVGYPLGELPVPIAPIYAALITLMIAVFGGAYAWLALQPEIHRPLLFLGAVVKIGFFTLFLVYWVAGQVPFWTVTKAIPHLVLGFMFIAWLRSTSGTVRR